MRPSTRLLLATSLLTLAAGCAGWTKPARKHELRAGQAYWFDYDASRRGALLIPKDQEFVICAEPVPDVALEIVNKLDLGATTGGVEGSAGFESEAEVVQLAQRSQTIMFLREALYRLCELQANQTIPKSQLADLYGQVIEAARQLAEAEFESATASAERARASRLEQERKLLEAKRKVSKAIDEIGRQSDDPADPAE